MSVKRGADEKNQDLGVGLDCPLSLFFEKKTGKPKQFIVF